MAELVKVPGIGPVKQTYVVGGLAAVVGVVGYAWWRKGTMAAAEVPAINPDSIPETDRTPVVGDSSGSWNVTNPEVISTNSQWTQRATEYLVGAGWEATIVGVALGRWLEGKNLTAQEQEIVLAAKGAFGDPPVGGPFPIKSGQPSTPSTGEAPPAPFNLRVDKDIRRNHLRWEHDGTNVTSFVVTAVVLGPGWTVTHVAQAVPTLMQYEWSHHLNPGESENHTVKYTIEARNGSVPGGKAEIESDFRMA